MGPGFWLYSSWDQLCDPWWAAPHPTSQGFSFIMWKDLWFLPGVLIGVPNGIKGRMEVGYIFTEVKFS